MLIVGISAALVQLNASACVHEAAFLCVKFALSLYNSSLNFNAR